MTFVTKGPEIPTFTAKGEDSTNVQRGGRDTPLLKDGSCDKSHCGSGKFALSCSTPTDPHGLILGRQQ
jgi:hypothetical protein